MDTDSQQQLNRTPSPPNAKSPSVRSSGLSVSGSGASSGRASTRESSPDLGHFSSSTSSSGIEPIWGGLESQDTMEHQHHYNPFDSSSSPTHPSHHTSDPGGSVVGPDFDPRSSSPGNQGLNLYNSTLLASSSMPRNQGLSNFTGPSSHNPSHRGLTSSNWRNITSSSINLPATAGENNSSSLAFSLLPAFSELQVGQINQASHGQFYNPFHHQTLNRPTTMSSPISISSPPSSPPSVCNANAPGNGTGNNGMASDNLNSGGGGTVSYDNPQGNNNYGSPQGNNNPGGHNPGNALSPNALLLDQVTHALAQGQNNGASTEMPCYGYCFDRGNGQYTRLIPADMLPPLVDIPSRQQGYLGMTVLPCPTGLAPNGRSSNLERVLIQPPPAATTTLTLRGGPGTRDPIQSRIDSIVATTPTQVETQRKQKIYCDKWIHEGVCAFTQQGCKYKHEMPLDKDTQESLGLFQGLPVWWRKHQGEITSDSQAGENPNVLGVSSAVITGGVPRARAGTGGRGGFGGQNRLRQNTWRSAAQGRPGGAGQPASPQGRGGGGQQMAVAQFSSPFGPIAPPSARREYEANPANNNIKMEPGTGRGSGSGIVHRNPWGILNNESVDDDGEDGPSAKLN